MPTPPSHEPSEVPCDPATVETPLQPLFSRILEAPVIAAPRSEKRVADVVKQHGIRLRLEPDAIGFEIFAASEPSGANRVVMGLGAIERIWAFVFAYTFLFQLTATAGTRSISVTKATHGPDALSLLNWALSSQHLKERQPWPTGASCPRRPLADQAFMARVNQIFLAVVGWILLHEFAHFDNGDMATTTTGVAASGSPHLEEFLADDWASARTLIGAVDLDYQQRACVIPFGLGVIAAIEHRASTSHPAVKDRLSRYVERFIVPLEERDPKCYTTALASSIIPLQALLYARGRLPEARTFPSWTAYVEHWNREMDH